MSNTKKELKDMNVSDRAQLRDEAAKAINAKLREMGKREFGNHQVVACWHIINLVGLLANGFYMKDYRMLFLQSVKTEQMTDALVYKFIRHDFLSVLCFLCESFFFLLSG